MRAENALAALLEAVAADVRDAVREELRGIARPRLIALDDAGVSRRALLEAERAGELRIYRRGKAGFVDAAELEAWIMRAPRAEEPDEPADEIGAVIELNRQRRRGRAAHG